MKNKFFISHHSGDKKIAELFSSALSRITLDQINLWYSSDGSEDGGLKPGEIWFSELLNKITQSKAVIALITPNSINKPWLYFESGIGQALENCKIIPVCIGLSRDEIFPPLGLYQCYQLNDYHSVVVFFRKLLRPFEIKFDEEIFKSVIEKLIQEISKIRFDNQEKKRTNNEAIEEIISNFKQHIDKRFLEVLEKPNYNIVGDNLSVLINDLKSAKHDADQETNYETSYSVSFEVDFPLFKNKNLYLDIWQNDTFQDIANKIYFIISEFVDPFTYLEQWLIVDPQTSKHVIIREIADRIPATAIFRPNTTWKVIKLDTPYSAVDSTQRIAASLDK